MKPRICLPALLLVFSMATASVSADTLAEYAFNTETEGIGLGGGEYTNFFDNSSNSLTVSAGSLNISQRVTNDIPAWGSPVTMEMNPGGIADYTPDNPAPFTNLFAGTSDFTIEMSIKVPSFDNDLFSCSGGPNSGGFDIRTDGNGRLVFSPRASADVTDPTPIESNTWYHVVVTYDASQNDLLLYRTNAMHGIGFAAAASNLNVDLALANTTNMPEGFVVGQFGVGVGVYTLARFNHLRISDTVLTPDQFLSADPLEIASLTIDVSDVVGVSFTSSPGIEYVLQYSTALDSNTWISTPMTIHGTGEELTVFDPVGPSTNKNYRILLE